MLYAYNVIQIQLLYICLFLIENSSLLLCLYFYALVEYASSTCFFNAIKIYIFCGCCFSLMNSVDDCNWDSPLNRLPESTAAFRILKHSFAVRGNIIYESYFVVYT